MKENDETFGFKGAKSKRTSFLSIQGKFRECVVGESRVMTISLWRWWVVVTHANSARLT